MHADKIVTSQIGLEYAALGKKPIITSNTYYDDFKLAIKYKNQKDYFHLLLNKNFRDFIKKMSFSKVNFKRKFEYVKKCLADDLRLKLVKSF